MFFSAAILGTHSADSSSRRGYTAERGARLLEAGLADMIAFGRPFIANPDLPQRIANGWPLNPRRPDTLYGGAEEGLTEYTVYQAA